VQVQVKLFASLRYHRPGLAIGESFPVELPAEATLDELVQELGLPSEEVKLLFVNGRSQSLEYALVSGDEVGIFPPVGGG
jgi:molybdopterin converting factor small subunit